MYSSQENKNDFDEMRVSSVISDLRNIQMKFKEMTNKVHIYSGKLKIQKINKKDENRPLPIIQKKTTIPSYDQTYSTYGGWIYNEKDRFPNNQKMKEKTEENKIQDRILRTKLRERLQLIQKKKTQESKSLKEKNKLTKENALILKERLKEENRQKTKIAETRRQMEKESIETYKKLKLYYIKEMITQQMMEDSRKVVQKFHELKNIQAILQ